MVYAARHRGRITVQVQLGSGASSGGPRGSALDDLAPAQAGGPPSGLSRPREGLREACAPEWRTRRISRGWRAFRTGVAFTAFGVGGLVVALVAFPILRWLPGPREIRERRAQRLLNRAFCLFTWFMEALGLIRVTRVSTERLTAARPTLVVANHPTLIDVVLLIACMPQADCVVKRGAWRNPFLLGAVAGAGYIPNDDGQALIDACASRLRAGRLVLLFPEGTRSPKGGLRPFHRGAAHVALDSGADVVPVVITCDPPTLMKGQRWYHVPDRTAHLVLAVGEPVPADGYLGDGVSHALAARRLTADLRAMYLSRLGYTEAG